MSQTASPDSVPSTDPSLAPEGQPAKTSLLGKIKNKTKDKTKKLRDKLTSPKGDAGDESSSSDEETVSPPNNDFSNVTQPAYERSLNDGQAPTESTTGTKEVSPSVPASDFPGKFAGAVTAPEQKGSDETNLSKDFEGLSTSEKPETPGSTPLPSEGDSSKPVTQKISDTLTGAKEKVADQMPGQEGSAQSVMSPDVSEKTGDVAAKTEEAGKTWTQWAAEKVGYAKDEVAAKTPDEYKDKATGVKDKTFEQATAVKDTATTKAGEYQSSIPSDPAEQTYTQKAFAGATAAKDAALAPPGDGEKDLSSKVTETISTFPDTLKTTLGMGGNSATSPTTTPATTMETSSGDAQSPGLVGRFTSLFGGAKKPNEEAASTTDSKVGEADTPSAEPTGTKADSV